MKFLIDMPLSPGLAVWLVSVGHDAVHASDIGMFRAPDREIMARAVLEGRSVVTADLDYPALLAMSGATAPSVILFRNGNWSDQEVIARVTTVLASLTDIELAESMIVVDRNRVRRRRLPLGN